jgi:soluble lytic murein transglycosylase
LAAAAVLASLRPLPGKTGRRCCWTCSRPFARATAKARTAAAQAGHALEPWAAYWELKLRLGDASPQEVQGFLQRWAGTYQEDRLRNDWLLLLGQRRDWAQLPSSTPVPHADDKEVRCYAC